MKIGGNKLTPPTSPLESKESGSTEKKEQTGTSGPVFRGHSLQNQFANWQPVQGESRENSKGGLSQQQAPEKMFTPAPKTNAAQMARMQNIEMKKVVQQQTQADPKDTTRGAADRLYKAMKGLGTNEAEIMRVLSDRSSEEIALIKKDFAAKTGGESLDSWLKSELGGSDMKKAELLMKGNDIAVEKRDTQMLKMAMEGVGTDEKAILDTLYGKTPKERQALVAEYEKETGRSLEKDLRSELSGSDQVKALAALNNGRIAPADELRAAMTGIGTNEKGIFRTLEGKSKEELAQIKTDYQKTYGRDLEKDLRSEMSGSEQVKALALLEKGKVSGADELQQAMKGLGTDEKAIRDVFKGKTPEERSEIIKDFTAHYGDLDQALKSELSDTEYNEVKTMMQTGDMSPAQKLNRAMRGFGTDEAAIMETLDGLSLKELAATKKEYFDSFGTSLDEHLSSELSGTAAEKATLLSANGRLSLSERIHFATEGMGTNEQELFSALENATPEERANLKQAYTVRYGGDVMDKLKGELSGADLKKATLLLEHGKLSPAQQLDVAMTGAGTREADIFKALDGASEADRKAILNDPAMMKRINSELSGNDLERTQLLLKNGSLTRTEQLHFAMDRIGTDEEAVTKALEGLNPEQRLQLQSDYKAQYGKDLMETLKSELGKRDMWAAEDALAQPPKTMRERLDRAELRSARERGHGSAISNASDATMDMFTDTGVAMEQELRELKMFAKQAQNGEITSLEADRLMKASETKLDKLSDEYLTEKQAVADTVGNIATVSVAAAAVAATGGLAALPAAALVAGAAGTTKVASKQLIMGNSYDLIGADGATDFVTGAGEGLAMMAGGKAADAISGAIGKRALAAQGKNVTEQGLRLLGRQALRESGGKVTMATVDRAAQGVLKKTGEAWLKQSFVRNVVGNSIQGAAKGAVFMGTRTAINTSVDDKVWDMEFTDAVKHIATQTGDAALQGAKGFAIGTAALKVGETASQTILKSIQMRMGQQMTAGRVFGEREMLKAGYEALGQQAKDVTRDQLMAAGRQKMILDVGSHFMDTTVRGQAMKITLENVLTRGIAAQNRTLFNGLGDHAMWEDGLSGAFEQMWQSATEQGMADATKFGTKDATMKLAHRYRVAGKGSAREALLSNVVFRSVGAGL